MFIVVRRGRMSACRMSAAGMTFVVFSGVPFMVFAGMPFVMFAGMPFVMFTRMAIVVAVSVMAMLGLPAAASVVAASAIVMEAIFAPAVGIAPAGPGTHAQENAVVEVRRPVKSFGRAAVGRCFVIAPLADGWFAYFNSNLRVSLWRWCHQGQARKQCCRAE